MDKLLNASDIPPIVMEAYHLLRQHRIVEMTLPIHRQLNDAAPGWVFECIVNVPSPNPVGMPPNVPLRVWVPEAFPYQPIDVFAISEEVSGFPHQDAVSRRLCLGDEHLAPRDASRLVCYMNWAREWLKDAANGTLMKPGGSYELPDFGRHTDAGARLPIEWPIIFEESSSSYPKWENQSGKTGVVECFSGKGIPAIFAVRFCDEDGSLIRKSAFSSAVLDEKSNIAGKWVMLSDIHYERHRPPQTYFEMESLCAKNGVDFDTILQAAWRLKNACPFGMLLIGCPIPKSVGELPTEIHWQPLFFQNLKGFRAQQKKRRHLRKPPQIWHELRSRGCLSAAQPLLWGRVENVTRERLAARGAHPAKVQATPMAVFGCGALGSSVAELLARGGVRRLHLFDRDFLQFGNLCRHTLDGATVGVNKARALAERLSRANPLSTLTGHPVGIPLNSRGHEDMHQVLADTDVFVDCTTSQTASAWLSHYAVEDAKRLVVLFFNVHAELLTLCVSSRSQSCENIFADFTRSVQQHQTPLDADMYFSEPPPEEQIREGAGCWHPSFPALHAHIQVLAAHAVEMLCHVIDADSASGLAAVVKRNPSVGQNGVQVGSLVEVVWAKQY